MHKPGICSRPLDTASGQVYAGELLAPVACRSDKFHSCHAPHIPDVRSQRELDLVCELYNDEEFYRDIESPSSREEDDIEIKLVNRFELYIPR